MTDEERLAALLAEIEQLKAQNAAMREIVQTVANAEFYSVAQGAFPNGIEYRFTWYSSDNTVERAQALLASEQDA